MTRKERAIKNLKQMCSDGRYLGSGSFAPLEVLEDFSTAIKVLEQEPKIKVLDRDEVARKLGEVDVYKASAWITLLSDLEYLGLKICEVEE